VDLWKKGKSPGAEKTEEELRGINRKGSSTVGMNAVRIVRGARDADEREGGGRFGEKEGVVQGGPPHILLSEKRPEVKPLVVKTASVKKERENQGVSKGYISDPRESCGDKKGNFLGGLCQKGVFMTEGNCSHF